MKKVHFYLRENKGKERTIYLCIRKGKNSSYRKSLGFYVTPSDWSSQKMRVKNSAKTKNKNLINRYLDNCENSIIQYYALKKLSNQEVGLREIKDFVLNMLYPERKSEDSFLVYLKDYLYVIEKRINLSTGKPLAKSTKEKFCILYRLLKEYRNNTNNPLCFENIDMDFYNDFVVFLQNKNYATNTIGKYICAMKTVLNDAFLKGKNINMCFKSKKFRVINETPTTVYITKKELARIQEATLSKTLSDSRNLFLLGCYTGLRYSDFSRLKKSNISNNYINIVQKKTGTPVVIPIHCYIESIVSDIEKLKVVSNTELNRNIKQICRIAGLNDKVLTTSVKGGKQKSELKEKWQLVCTHTARRTFATNLYLEGVPTITIMKITGHKTETSFMRYIRVSQEENAKILQTHWKKESSKFVN